MTPLQKANVTLAFIQAKFRLLLLVAAMVCAIAPASLSFAQATGCEVVFAAADRLNTIPNHIYMTTTAGYTHGKPESSEMIVVDGAQYVFVRGTWRKSPMSIADRVKQEAENRKNAKNSSCHFAHEEAVNGEPAAVYSAHSETDDDKVDSQIWISKRQGRILKQELDMDVGGGDAGKSHRSIRYEYGNVAAPNVTH